MSAKSSHETSTQELPGWAGLNSTLEVQPGTGRERQQPRGKVGTCRGQSSHCPTEPTVSPSLPALPEAPISPLLLLLLPPLPLPPPSSSSSFAAAVNLCDMEPSFQVN